MLLFPFREQTPFRTDDPEAVEFRNWETYLASQYQDQHDSISLTAPHIEINYGLVPNVQVHLIVPMLYVKPAGEPSPYGYSDTEFGLKWRFYENKELDLQIGTFPLVEIPTGDENKGLGNGDPQGFFPLWLQKGWGPWTTYGGGGYWVNPGTDHKNYWFAGWEIQREITRQFALGGEIFYQTPSEPGGVSQTGFNLGGIINITDNHHMLFSAGRDIDGPTQFQYYVAYQYTFGPTKPKETEEK